MGKQQSQELKSSFEKFFTSEELSTNEKRREFLLSVLTERKLDWKVIAAQLQAEDIRKFAKENQEQMQVLLHSLIEQVFEYAYDEGALDTKSKRSLKNSLYFLIRLIPVLQETPFKAFLASTLWESRATISELETNKIEMIVGSPADIPEGDIRSWSPVGALIIDSLLQLLFFAGYANHEQPSTDVEHSHNEIG